MAAAEYYNSGSGGPAQQAPRPNPLPPAIRQTPPYPMFDGPPPPYTPMQGSQRPQSQPPPQQRVRFDTTTPQPAPPNRPNGPPNADTHQYPPEKVPQQLGSSLRPISNPQNMYRPSDFTSSHPPMPPQSQPQVQYQPPPPNGYLPPPGTNPMSQVYGGNTQPYPQRRYSSSAEPQPSGRYDSDSRSRSRSRSRDRRHRRHDHIDRARPPNPRKKGSGVNTFLGAGGGAIIGDLIFPGLGTLGGAILGGVGGHEYGKQRAEYGPKTRARSDSRQHTRTYSNDRDYYYNDDGRRGRK